MADTKRPEFLEPLFEAWGEPRVSPPENKERGVFLQFSSKKYWRRAWVWFPGGKNHGLHIDDYGHHWEVSLWANHLEGQSRRADFSTPQPPTNDQMKMLIALVFGDLK